MSQMAGSKDSFFEVIERFTPTENIVDYTFKHHGVGVYVFCEDPVLTVGKGIEENRPIHSLIEGNFVIYENANKALLMRVGTSLTFATSGGGYCDFWGTGASINNDEVTFRVAQADSNIVTFYAGHTYVILMLKARKE